MTIEEMQKAREQAEQAIAEAVQQFMTKTGLPVDDVRVRFTGWTELESSKARRIVASVTLDVRL